MSALLSRSDLSSIVYLGPADDAAELSKENEAALLGDEARFAEAALHLSRTGDAASIRALLEGDLLFRYGSRIRVLPPPPARAIDVIDARVVLWAQNKSSLEEEDIVNAQLIVFGDASRPEFRRFGSRAFFSPGPLALSHIGLIELHEGTGRLEVSLMRLDGERVWQEAVSAKAAKVSVRG